jgi:hypothetical protein
VDRAQKEKVVEELGQIFESSGVVVVSHYEGLTVAEMQDLRARMREAGGSVRVAKNRLAKIALEGTDVAGIAEFLTGMTVLVLFRRPRGRGQGCRGLRQGEREVRNPWRSHGWNGSGPRRCFGRVQDAVARGAYRLHRRLHRAPGFEHRRGHWRTCFEYRFHPFHHRGKGGGRIRHPSDPASCPRWNTILHTEPEQWLILRNLQKRSWV